MIRHLFTLIWNRKRANSLLIVEIFLAFIILFVVGSVLVYIQRNYRAPLGFAYEQVWQVSLNSGTQPHSQEFNTFQQILHRLRTMPGVENVASTGSNTPFTSGMSNGPLSTGPGTSFIMTNFYVGSAELCDVLGLRMRQGRWFDRRDEAATRPPVVITEMSRQALFPEESPLGKIIYQGPTEWQVIGVVDHYRGGTVLSEEAPGAFRYNNPQDTSNVATTLLVRVRPGVGAELEKRMSEAVRTIGPTWTSIIKPMPELRRTQLKQLLPLPVLLGVICTFLIINVALGLFGVLWLNISRRRGEIGVRRAMGATAGNISLQVLGEILVLTTFGLVMGLLVAMQFPLLGVLSVQTSVYLTAMVLAAGLLYLLATVCALYPSRLAAGIQPAVALREE